MADPRNQIKNAALERLRQTLKGITTESDAERSEIVAARDEVLARYGPIFDHSNLSELTAEQFKSFLLYKNNRHWKSIHRQGNQIVEDMDALRETLGVLLDEKRPLIDRLRALRPKNGEPMIKGLARSVITPILLVAHPEKYGVLNQVAEIALIELGLWPKFERGADFAARYSAVNEVLNILTEELEIDLWTLDTLWSRYGSSDESASAESDTGPFPEMGENVFGLEQHLHDFLYDNWEQTELGREWELLEEDGEVIGYKYNTGDVGEIDLLAKHRTESRWLVIELKRRRTSDQALGQALRYRGWVKRHLAQKGETVEAMVICHVADPKLLYAMEGVDDVSARTYSVHFNLEVPETPWDVDPTSQ